MHHRPRRIALALLLVLLLPAPLPAQDAEEEQSPPLAWDSSYELPGEDIQEMFRRDKNYAVLDTPSGNGDYFLVPRYSELSTVARMGEPTQRLAGLELRGQRNRTWRMDTYGIVGASVYHLESEATTELQLPGDSHYSDFAFSPDGVHMAVLRHPHAGPTELWMVDLPSGRAGRLGSAEPLATLATRVEQSSARRSGMVQMTPTGEVITLAVPAGRGPAPERGVPAGPVVRRTRDEALPNPTYPFLLEDAHEEALFRYHTTSQLVRVERDGSVVALGDPGMFTSIQLSPDGEHVLTERIVEPLSPLVGAFSFGRTLEVRDMAGAVLETIRDTPLREGRGDNGDRDQPREVMWLPDGSTLAWLQRESRETEADGADEDEAAEESEDEEDPKDQIVLLDAPFAMDSMRVVAASEDSLSGLGFNKPGDQAFAEASVAGGKRMLRRYPVDGAEAVDLVGPWDPRDPLELPGELLHWYDAMGNPHVITETGQVAVFLQGPGYTENFRPRPFVDRVPTDGGDSERIFEGAADMYEQPLVPLDRDVTDLLVQRESSTTFPNTWRWTRDGGFGDQLTANADPFPEVTAQVRQDFSYTRRDGLEVQGRVWMPVGWQEGDDPAPAMIWTYPSEYDTPKDYQRDAIRDWNLNEFMHMSYLRWSLLWTTQGYALVHPDVPIVGEPYNDNYIQHLSDSLYAAIREIDNLGLVDPDRVGHGGHSYGAFATGNLLTRTPYFRAGIAGDGAYNRTLTPMGFQREPRYVWQARETYLEMSPFFHADHLDTPLLMYHGGDDNNTGTFPIQSRRFMQALQGLDKNAVLYEYPFESHGPRAIESYLDLWKRFIDFFDMYVKSPAMPEEVEDE